MSTNQLKANIKHEKYLLNAAYDALHEKQTAKKKPHKTNKAKSTTSFIAILPNKSKSFNKNLHAELTQSKITQSDLDDFNKMFN